MTKTQENRWTEIGNDALRTGRNVWLAGLGAVATVNEKRRVFFADLVDRGERLEKQERRALTRRWDETSTEVKNFGKKLEEGLEERMSSTMERFGVPSRREVQDLIHRIEDLTKKVETLAVH